MALEGLQPNCAGVTSPPMKLFYACLIYVVMGAILAAGIVLTVKGSPWLLIISFLVYAITFSKVGCLHH